MRRADPSTLAIIAIGLLVSFVYTRAIAATGAGESRQSVPAWVFALNPPIASAPAPFDHIKPLHVPNSTVTYNEAQLNDLYAAPDWHPDSHSAMPKIVAYGNAPHVYVCGFCHTAGGQGRPENASLAGLPAAYIIQQVADFKSGARRGAWPGPYRPADCMIEARRTPPPSQWQPPQNILLSKNSDSESSSSNARALQRGMSWDGFTSPTQQRGMSPSVSASWNLRPTLRVMKTAMVK